mgnify:CR=1 FL=1
MQYTVNQIIEEIGLACEQVENAEELFQSVWGEYLSTKEAEALHEALNRADDAKTSWNLYLKCLFEMAAKTIIAALCEVWTESDFLQRWEGTPWHYKRLRSALAATAQRALPEGLSVDICVSERDTWATPKLMVRCRVPGDDEGMSLVVDSYVPYALAPVDDGGVRVFKLIDGEPVPQSPDFPSFPETFKACESACAVKHEREKILDDAIGAARALAYERCLGFSTLRDEIESRRYEF